MRKQIARIFTDEHYVKYILIAPVTIAILGIAIYPFFFSLKISFTEATTGRIFDAPFNGLENYIKIATSEAFLNSVKVTLIFTFAATLLEATFGLVVALLLNRNLKYKRIFVVAIIVPIMISPVIYAIFYKVLLNSLFGVIPYYFSKLGLEVNFFGSPGIALFTLVGVDLLQWTPFMFIILYAGLQSLPKDPFDAARVDGASNWQLFRHITLPLLKPVLVIALIFRTMDAFRVFGKIFALTGGGPGGGTMSISMLTYYRAFNRFSFGEASAITVLALIIIIVISQFYLRFIPAEVKLT